VLLVTGGHGYATNEFLEVFQKNAAIDFTHAVHAKTSSTAYDREDLLSYDCILLYDMVQNITDAQKARLLATLDRGIGLVVTHHALVSYQAWPEFEKIVGGTYPESQNNKGKVTAELGYEHDVEMPIVIVAKDHPITVGLRNFTITDEIYWGFRVSPDVTTLVTTTHPKSGKPIAWAHNYRQSRVVYLQLGHGPSAYENENYRKLLAQCIRWTAEDKPRQ
ncbi:MAG TPA: ThuA domain-containing protein, partial [Candidatus Acidoferrum sp.]|nr:ThuA domain-containing protein [Candidatus Acidoferrum sp.]